MPFLSDQKNWRAPRPPPTLIFANCDRSKFEIVILFKIVENYNNYVFEDDLLPQSPPGEGLQVTNFDRCLHTVMVIGSV